MARTSPSIPKRALAHAATMPTNHNGHSIQPGDSHFLKTDWQNGYGRAVSPDKAQVDDERRPSVASASTVSSNGSSRSKAQAIHRKLQGIFGEDLPANEGREASQFSFASQQTFGEDQNFERLPRPSFGRKGSSANAINSAKGSRQASPDASRPRTPQQPSSEVTPWMYQSKEVCHILAVCFHLDSLEVHRTSTSMEKHLSETPSTKRSVWARRKAPAPQVIGFLSAATERTKAPKMPPSLVPIQIYHKSP